MRTHKFLKLHSIIVFLFIFSVTLIISCSCTYQRMFYYPDKKNLEIQITEYPSENIFLTSKNGKQINCLFVKSNVAPVATILFLHGNAGNITHWKKPLETLAKNGFQTFIIDYQGFGKSEGKPKHKTLLQDAETALSYIKMRDDCKNIKLIVLGTSIGGHLAITLTKKHQNNINALVSEGAFTSHNEIATYMVPWFIKPLARLTVLSQYRAKKNIKQISIPKLIIHSTDDAVIPFAMGKKLYKNATEPKEFWEIKGKHIHGILDYETEYIHKLKNIIG